MTTDYKACLENIGKEPTLQTYTVILQYPEGITDGELQTYCAVVEAGYDCGAILVAKAEASEANDGIPSPWEFLPLFVFEGDITPLMLLSPLDF